MTRHDPSPDGLRPREHTIERLLPLLEAATKGNALLDAEIVLAVYGRPSKTVAGLMNIGIAHVLTFTTSLDAAATLVPPDANCHGYDFGPSGATAYVSRNDVPAGHCYFDADAPTAALALCIAAVKAHAHMLKSVPSVAPTQDRGASTS